MNFRKIDSTYICNIVRGEEIVAALQKFAEDERIQAASIEGIGAAADVVIGWYDVVEHAYEWKTLPEAHEITSMIGNITQLDDEPHVHVHVTLGARDFSVLGGHLKSGVVSGACEVIIRPLSDPIGRQHDEETGLRLLAI